MESSGNRGRHPRPALPLLLMALLAVAVPAFAAPPEVPDSPAADPAAPAVAPAELDHWPIPTFRVNGAVGLDQRSDHNDEGQRSQRSTMATLTVLANTYLWEPWFARADGSLGLTMTRDKSTEHDTDPFRLDADQRLASHSLIVTGSLRLSVLALSPYPFEFHFDRNNSRVSSEQTLANDYQTQRYGFTQHWRRPEGDTMFGWDHNTQTSARDGRDSQDSLQASATHTIDTQRFAVTADANRNEHKVSGETAEQANLALNHSYAPSNELAFENMLNVSHSAYDLRLGSNRTHLTQLSTVGLWRPEDQDLTVTGGARVFALDVDALGRNLDRGSSAGRARNVNLNGGVNYDLSPEARLYAAMNANMIQNAGARSNNTSQTMGASYQPATLEFGNFRYGWAAGATAGNRSGGTDGGRQVGVQLSHHGGYVLRATDATSFAADLSQGIQSLKLTNPGLDNSSVSRQVTHGASLSWDYNSERGGAMARLSVSDARNYSNHKEFFQMANLQFSSSMNLGVYSSWTGSLTVQATRQGFGGLLGRQALENQYGKSFTPTSSAALSYQHQRLFGVRNLRFVSDFRINGQTLFPALTSVQDQETAAWDNRLDYTVGKLRLRVNTLISRSSNLYSGAAPSAPLAQPLLKRTNRTLVFGITRAFGG